MYKFTNLYSVRQTVLINPNHKYFSKIKTIKKKKLINKLGLIKDLEM